MNARGVLVTRPSAQAASLATRLRAAGFEPVEFPALEIVGLTPPPPAFEPDAVLFVSPNAAVFGVPLLRTLLPPRIYAVGVGTAQALAEAGMGEVETPDGQDSEALLALPGLQSVAGQRLLIVRGVGGRALLGDTLRTRGAGLDYFECYERRCPTHDASELLAHWERIAAVTITSVEAWRNLVALVGDAGRERLAATPVFAPHAKIVAGLHALGVQQAITTGGGDAGLVAGLVHWFRNPQ